MSNHIEGVSRMTCCGNGVKEDSAQKKGNSGGFLSKRVERNLDLIVAQWERELGSVCKCLEGDSAMFKRILSLSGVDELDEIRLGYEVARRLLASLYTFVYDFEVCVPPGEKSCSIEFRSGRFECVCGSSRIPELLDTALVKDRMEALGITDIRIEIVSQKQVGSVRMVGLVGSSTWNLIPPVLHFIPFRDGECVKAVELMRMIAVAMSG